MNTGIIACRSAPTENGSSGDQITRPRYCCSASSTAFSRPSITPGPMACILVLIDSTSTSAPSPDGSVHSRTASSSNTALTAVGAGRRAFAEQRRAEELALVHGQRRASDEGFLRARDHEPSGGVHAARLGDRPIEDPLRQRRLGQRLAGVDVGLHPLGDLLPAGGLPGLERPDGPAEAPAQREVDVTRGVGDRLQVDRDVVEGVAEDRPQEFRLRVIGLAQQLEPLGRILLFEDP